ncbi:hypothetical protein DVA67_001505 [Solirubrobacter sp. CPCC 204708]|uniref:DUF4430 domain-containing protein n=1 Tax=Solirubrobacter deserti TaxID=2282478 RepID=A0ABT4RDP6_9ACTN|nr:hypothetical protein [Solirubrobacter deserti]MBE2314633.1 hypothetical protein [Solirubrobacter deserti]MDA0136640.1 DUF4430 domain-containing protein [Solirubrobacter deserti]
MRRVILAAVLAALAAGCGSKAEVPTGGRVAVTVSQDFGETRLAPTRSLQAAEQDTVLDMLDRSQFEVRASGAAVEEIDGLSGGRENGKPVEWFSYVNGIATPSGAATRKLYSGDRIWYDHHGTNSTVRAVVGSFPQPFTSGIDGKKLPIRVVCLAPEDRSCDEVEERLEAAGIRGLTRSNLESSPGEVLRVLVGTWAEVRKDIAARTLETGPAESGVFARMNAAGNEIELLDPDGAVEKTLGPGAGLVAATAYRDQRPTWMITGTDDVGVAAAAAALTEDMLRFRFALAIEEGRGVPLPVEGP